MPRNNLIRIEVMDPETGGRVTVMVDGVVPRSLSESIGKYISSVLSSGGSSPRGGQVGKESSEASTGDRGSSSTFEKVRSLLLKHFRYGSFTSHDIQDEFERAFGEKLRGSTVSTYLLRLSDRANGILERRQGTGGYEYRLRSENVEGQRSEAGEIHAFRNSLK